MHRSFLKLLSFTPERGSDVQEKGPANLLGPEEGRASRAWGTWSHILASELSTTGEMQSVLGEMGVQFRTPAMRRVHSSRL